MNTELELLNKQLQEIKAKKATAVAAEEWEMAAALRDREKIILEKIKALEQSK